LTKQKSFIVGKATNPLLKPCENSDIYAFMINSTKKNYCCCPKDGVVVGDRLAVAIALNCFKASLSYTP